MLNRRFSAQVAGGRGGGAGSHPLPGHVIQKQTVNITLARGHHTQTWRTARNVFNIVYDSSTPNKTVHYYFRLGKTT